MKQGAETAGGRPRPPWYPILLSAFVYPGLGQFIQRRWIVGVVYLAAYTAFMSATFGPLFKMFISSMKTAIAVADGGMSAIHAESLLAPAGELLSPFGAAWGVWFVNLVDVAVVYFWRRRNWSGQRSDDGMKKILPMITAVVSLLCGSGDAATNDIFAAVRSNDLAAVERIVAASGVSAVDLTSGDGATPLHVAAALDFADMCVLLIKKGAAPDVRTGSGFTPLHWAASRDACAAADLLVLAGADVNAVSAKGITPLHWAAYKNATNAIKLLIRSGAKPAAVTEQGLTPLHWAMMDDAYDAAVIVAYKTVSDEMEAETTGNGGPGRNLPESVPEVEKGKNGTGVAAETQDIERSKVAPVPADAESDLIVPLGHGEELILVWAKDLGVWVGKYEVTNGQYKRYDSEHKSLFRGKHSLDDRWQPAVLLTWNDCKAFCRWLNRDHGDSLPLGCEFRLPLEREWVVFAGCGTRRSYPWGDGMPPEYGNYFDSAGSEAFADSRGIKSYRDGHPAACPVNESGVNEWGLFGVGGNVWEWCEDWRDKESDYKIRRGGSWYSDEAASLAIDYRGFDLPDAKDDTIGFRVVVAKTQR